MTRFRGTWLFLIVVVCLGGFAYFDYQKQLDTQKQEALSKQLYGDIGFNDLMSFELIGPQKFLLKKIDTTWSLEAPINDHLDLVEFVSYVGKILSQQVVQIPKSEIQDLGSFGFDQPLARIKLEAKDQVYSFSVSRKRSFDEGYYLQKSNDENLYVGSSAWTGLINKLPKDFRNKEPFESLKSLAQLKVTDQKTLSFIQKKDLWFLETDISFKIDQQAINDYVSQITGLKALEIQQGRVPRRLPDLKLQLADFDGQTIEAAVWKSKEGSSKLVIGEEQKVYILSKDSVSFLDRQLDDLKEKPKPSPQPDEEPEKS